MGVGVQPVVTDHDLALVGNVRGHPGDKYVAVDIEAGVRPGENALGPLEGPVRAVAAVVGKAADIKPPLAKFRTWEEKKITDPVLSARPRENFS